MSEHTDTVMKDMIDKYISSSNENKTKFEAYTAWLSYYGGFSGVGTTALDIKPNFEMPFDVPALIRMEAVIFMQEECRNRWENWRQAVIQTIDEDPGAGWQLPEKLEIEFNNAHKANEWLSDLKKNILDEVDIKAKRLSKISDSGWLLFFSIFTGEYKRLHKEVRLMFENFDKLSVAQSGEK